ncbi:hypothetical protein ELI00_32435 (plasmid) [Rhizobium ruizarguesonis]|uniref:hypothetical protein n=1 Tax=Rhizobium ruizarguesonis TaxID=2081791 RepID=UPI0010326ACC|nr:hypothetical protein [Rhizobium ruizarguesonis]TAX65852.1 hypothetical protein ELI00_32435 [Rhizobium ruizarguesonis]
MTETLEQIKHRVRLLQLLTSAEQAALAPISLDKLHAFAYLADILSPVWNLRPFEDRIGRTGRPPYYPDLQLQLDLLVGMGLVEPSELSYQRDDSGEARFSASYALRFSSKHLEALALEISRDPDSAAEQLFLNALADALASLPDEDIARAASRDLVYERSSSDAEDYVDLESLAGQSRTEKAVASFDQVFPGSKLTPARRLFMYANYLGRRAHG